MKKRVLQVVVSLMLCAFLGCSNNENETTAVELNQIEEQFIVEKLPENAISIDQIIELYAKASNKTISTRLLTNGNTNSSNYNVNGYIKIFVLYPVHWKESRKIDFFLNVRKNVPGVFTVVDSCEYVDTFYFPVASVAQLRDVVPEKDRDKNLIVATDSTNHEDEDEDDGPKDESIFYNSCGEIPLSGEYFNLEN